MGGGGGGGSSASRTGGGRVGGTDGRASRTGGNGRPLFSLPLEVIHRGVLSARHPHDFFVEFDWVSLNPLLYSKPSPTYKLANSLSRGIATGHSVLGLRP